MSFNIRYSLADDGENGWDKRKTLVLARIRAFEPDLLGLQECRDDGQAAFIKSNLPDDHFFGVRREGAGEPALEMAPILFRKAAFERVEAGCFWLSETPQVPGSRGQGAVFPRTATWVRLIHQPSGRALTFLNTHFDHEPAAADRAAQLLRRWCDQTGRDTPLIVTGDFNADKDSAAYRRLTGRGGPRDAARQLDQGADNEGTFHDFGRAETIRGIDWILVSDHFHVVAAGVDRWRAGDLFPSDHFPVTAVLNWRD